MSLLVQTKNPTANEVLDIGSEYAITWVNLSNSLTNNNLYSNANFGSYVMPPGEGGSLPESAFSHYLYFHTLDFSLPANAVIDGIRVTVDRYATGDEVNDYYVGLVYPSSGLEITSPGKQKSAFWPGTDATTVYGDYTDKWNRIWTRSEINSDDFGFVISAQGSVVDLDAANIDWVQISVYYHGGEDVDATGGAVADGTATQVAATYNAIFTGSALGTGHAALVLEDVVAEGGITANGEAFEDYSIFGQGIILANGDADSQTIFRLGIGSATGAKASGSADVYLIAEATYYSYGVLLIGTASVESYFIVQGGAFAGAEANNELISENSMLGGITLAPLHGIDPMFGEGGATPSGESSVDVLYADDDGEGGIILSGIAAIAIESQIEGSTLGGGSATELTVHIFATSGGSLVSSLPGENAIITPFWDSGSGGPQIGGISFIEPYMPLGGATLGGSAECFEILDTDLTEYEWVNFLSSGESVPPESHGETGWAYCWLSESNRFGWYIGFTFTGNAQSITINGPAEEGENGERQLAIGQLSGNDWASPIQGSVVISDEQKADLLAGLWYWRVLSWDNKSIRSQIETRNGLDVGGAVVQNYDQTTESGAVGSSTQVERVIYATPLPTGGSLLNGESTIIIASVVSGGSSVSGIADVDVVYDSNMIGGITVIGDANEGVIYESLTSGGATLNSEGIIGIAPAISGGALVYGTHEHSFFADPPVTGGVLAAPIHIQSFTDFYDGEGGIRVGGKTIGERLRTYESRHLNYGFAMGSENIFTRVVYEHALIPPTNDEAPELPEGYFRIEHEPGWCDVKEKCEQGTLPKVVQRRQGQYLPPKIGRTTIRDRGIARVM